MISTELFKMLAGSITHYTAPILVWTVNYTLPGHASFDARVIPRQWNARGCVYLGDGFPNRAVLFSELYGLLFKRLPQIDAQMN